MAEKLTAAERRILQALNGADEPLFCGSLGVLAEVSWRSRLFDRLTKRGLLAGYPYAITELGRASLSNQEE